MSLELPLAEITLRRYEKPYQTEKRELCKKICLSLGLLQPGDSRDIIVDVLLVLLEAKKTKEKLTSFVIRDNVIEMRKKYHGEQKGIAESNIRRQLKRLRDIMLIDKSENLYNISEFASLGELFEQKIEKFLLPQITQRVKEYLNEMDKN